MASLTLAQLRTQVQDLIGDNAQIAGTNNQTYSDAQIADAINYAIQDLCTKQNWTYLDADVTATTPFQSYSMIGTIQDYLKIRRVFLKNSGTSPATYTELLKSSYVEEDVKNAEWRQLTADMVNTFPRRWVSMDGETIFIIPRPTAAYPSGTTVTITVGYIQRPAALVSDSDTVDDRIPWPVQIYLKYAACAWLKQLSGQDTMDPSYAKVWMDMYNQLISQGDS